MYVLLFQAEDGIRDIGVTGVQTCALPIFGRRYGFVAEARHINLGGVVHGGMLMSFADDVLGMTVWEAAGRKPCTTVQLNTRSEERRVGKEGRSRWAPNH